MAANPVPSVRIDATGGMPYTGGKTINQFILERMADRDEDEWYIEYVKKERRGTMKFDLPKIKPTRENWLNPISTEERVINSTFFYTTKQREKITEEESLEPMDAGDSSDPENDDDTPPPPKKKKGTRVENEDNLTKKEKKKLKKEREEREEEERLHQEDIRNGYMTMEDRLPEGVIPTPQPANFAKKYRRARSNNINYSWVQTREEFLASSIEDIRRLFSKCLARIKLGRNTRGHNFYNRESYRLCMEHIRTKLWETHRQKKETPDVPVGCNIAISGTPRIGKSLFGTRLLQSLPYIYHPIQNLCVIISLYNRTNDTVIKTHCIQFPGTRSCQHYELTKDGRPWVPKESDDLTGLEGCIHLSDGLNEFADAVKTKNMINIIIVSPKHITDLSGEDLVYDVEYDPLTMPPWSIQELKHAERVTRTKECGQLEYRYKYFGGMVQVVLSAAKGPWFADQSPEVGLLKKMKQALSDSTIDDFMKMFTAGRYNMTKLNNNLYHIKTETVLEMKRNKKGELQWTGLFYTKETAWPGSEWVKAKMMEAIEKQYKNDVSSITEQLDTSKTAGTVTGHLFASNFNRYMTGGYLEDSEKGRLVNSGGAAVVNSDKIK